MPHKDPKAKREYHRNYIASRLAKEPEYRKKHRQRVNESNARAREKTRALVAEFRKDGCIVCGEKEPCCLQAHHVTGKKEYDVAALMQGRHGVERVKLWTTLRFLRELAKCVCICANCHCKVHAGIVELSKARSWCTTPESAPGDLVERFDSAQGT